MTKTMNLTKYVSSITLALTLIATCWIAFYGNFGQFATTGTHEQLWGPTIEKYKKAAQTEHAQLMNEFFELCGATQQEWETAVPQLAERFKEFEVKQIKELIAENPKPVEQKYQDLINTLLRQKGVDPATISVISNGKYLPAHAMMCAGNSFIVINEAAINELNFNEMDIQAFIAHEIEHIGNGDFGEIMMMHYFIADAKNADRTNWKALEKKFNLFREKRVDIAVGLKGFDYLKSRCKCTPGAESHMNPSTENHLAYMLQVKKEMLASLPQEQRTQLA